jgi:hypothetical protein
MPDVCCQSETREDGVRICALHGQPLIGEAEVRDKEFTEGKPVFGGEWFCPVTGSAFGSFEVVDALHEEIAEV